MRNIRLHHDVRRSVEIEWLRAARADKRAWFNSQANEVLTSPEKWKGIYDLESMASKHIKGAGMPSIEALAN